MNNNQIEAYFIWLITHALIPIQTRLVIQAVLHPAAAHTSALPLTVCLLFQPLGLHQVYVGDTPTLTWSIYPENLTLSMLDFPPVLTPLTLDS